MRRPIIIGIAGGSGSGKTTVLHAIMDAIGSEHIALLDHDAYYRPLDHLTLDERSQINFDHPDSLETDLMCTHLDQLLSGESIAKPLYNFATHTRKPHTEIILARSIIIVEGILVLAEPTLVDRMDIKIFVDAPDDVRLIRRVRRDLFERGRTIESVLEQYEQSVRPMHLQFVAPSKRQADVIIPRGGHNRVAIDMVIARIQTLLQRSTKEIVV